MKMKMNVRKNAKSSEKERKKEGKKSDYLCRGERERERSNVRLLSEYYVSVRVNSIESLMKRCCIVIESE